MKTTFNNAELAHIWAQQKQEEGRGSNMFFNRQTIYSYGYHYPIATFVKPNVILFNSEKSSVTTEGKHKNKVRRAIDFEANKVFYVPNLCLQGTSANDHAANILFIENEIENLISLAAKARKNFDYYLGQAVKGIGILEDYISTFHLKPTKAAKELIARRDNLLPADVLEALKEKERQRSKREREKKAGDIAEWIGGGSNKGLHKITEAFLRRDGDYVETSYGASAPIKEAHTLYKALKAGKDIRSFQIGNYYVTRFANGILKIGCHTITEQEIDRFAASQKWA